MTSESYAPSTTHGHQITVNMHIISECMFVYCRYTLAGTRVYTGSSTWMFSSWYSRSVLSVFSRSVWSRASCSPWVRWKMWVFWASICCCSFSCCVGESSCYFTICDFATFKFPTIDCFQQSQQLNLPAQFDTCHCRSFYITAVNVQQTLADMQSHGPRHHLKISVGINLSK